MTSAPHQEASVLLKAPYRCLLLINSSTPISSQVIQFNLEDMRMVEPLVVAVSFFRLLVRSQRFRAATTACRRTTIRLKKRGTTIHFFPRYKGKGSLLETQITRIMFLFWSELWCCALLFLLALTDIHGLGDGHHLWWDLVEN
jgi:hypothetical protein